MALKWKTRIARARKRGSFTLNDKKAARDWRHCACGERDKWIESTLMRPFGEDFYVPVPKDKALYTNGVGFATAVEMNRFDDAEALLASIQTRTCELWREKHGEEPSGI